MGGGCVRIVRHYATQKSKRFINLYEISVDVSVLISLEALVTHQHSGGVSETLGDFAEG